MYLDDTRNPIFNCVEYDGTIVWVKSYQEFTEWIEKNGLPDKVSFDYYLNDREYDGLSCAKAMIVYCIDNNKLFPEYEVHSTSDKKDFLKKYIKQTTYLHELCDEKALQYFDEVDEIIKNEESKYDGKICDFNSTEEYNIPYTIGKNYIPNLKSSIPPAKSKKTLGRNEQCSCSSGKKFKHCCGK